MRMHEEPGQAQSSSYLGFFFFVSSDVAGTSPPMPLVATVVGALPFSFSSSVTETNQGVAPRSATVRLHLCHRRPRLAPKTSIGARVTFSDHYFLFSDWVLCFVVCLVQVMIRTKRMRLMVREFLYGWFS